MTGIRTLLGPFGVTGLCCLLLSGCWSTKDSQTKPYEKRLLNIAADTALEHCLLEVIAAFHRQNPGVRVQPTFGASGALRKQIAAGSKFDLFLAADPSDPKQLIEDGLADQDSLLTFAQGYLVLCAAKSSDLKVGTRGMEILQDPAVKKIAIPEPALDRYGATAESALKTLGLHETIATRLKIAESASQAAQFVEYGTAEAAFTAISLAMSSTLRVKAEFWKLPATAAPPLEHCVVILKNIDEREAAELFQQFLTTSESRSILESFGLTASETKK